MIETGRREGLFFPLQIQWRLICSAALRTDGFSAEAHFEARQVGKVPYAYSRNSVDNVVSIKNRTPLSELITWQTDVLGSSEAVPQ